MLHESHAKLRYRAGMLQESHARLRYRAGMLVKHMLGSASVQACYLSHMLGRASVQACYLSHVVPCDHQQVCETPCFCRYCMLETAHVWLTIHTGDIWKYVFLCTYSENYSIYIYIHNIYIYI